MPVDFITCFHHRAVKISTILQDACPFIKVKISAKPHGVHGTQNPSWPENDLPKTQDMVEIGLIDQFENWSGVFPRMAGRSKAAPFPLVATWLP
ncbi:MAG: hypothetical protein FWD31_06175 [Planctomycetaceae bacterium]|nr:hypothetical protein [Planctomycetaceae bacterium]